MFQILIAEDEEPIANLIKMNLTKAGYKCIWAPDGNEAANAMEKEHFDVVIDISSHMVTRNGEEIYLTPKEFELLLLFARNRNIALYRETIYENVWSGEYMGQSRTVDLHVQRLKKKLQ